MSFKNVIRIENKKRVSGITKPVNYSTEEHIIGTWIDGSTLYEKTVNVGDMPNNSQNTIIHGISNLDFVVSYEGFAKHKTVARNGFPLPFVVTGGTANIRISVNGDNIQVFANGDYSSYAGYVTLRYTKTS